MERAEHGPISKQGSTSTVGSAGNVDIKGGLFESIGGNKTVNNYFVGPKVPYTCTADDIHRMSDWLTLVNYRKIQKDNLAKRTPNTGNWFLSRNDLREWICSDGGTLWAVGIPGAGKTVLTSVVVDHLQRLRGGNRTVCVVYAYCRYTDSIDVRDILAALIRQQLERYPAVAYFVKPFFDLHQRERTTPSLDELVEMLHKIARSPLFSKSFYIVDGLDEARNDTQFDLLRYLASLPVNLFITSRPPPSYCDIVRNARLITIVAQDSDIVLLVAQKIGRISGLRKLLENKDLMAEVVSKVLKKSCGMFLAASFQLDMLGDCMNVRSLREALERLPEGVNAMYAATMIRVERQPNSNLARRVLTWLVYACSSLSMEQLRYAVAISSDTYQFDPDLLVEGESLVFLCCGLITHDPSSGSVRLVHFTAKDYLKPYLERDGNDPQFLIASTCAACLLQYSLHNYDGDSSAIEVNLGPNTLLGLLRYSRLYWPHHARQSQLIPPTVLSFVQQCLRHPFQHEEYHDELLNEVQVAAAYNLQQLLVAPAPIQKIRSFINSTSLNMATPLILASLFGHVEVVRALLAVLGVDINLQDGKGATALIHSAHRGHTDVVRILLKTPGIKVNSINFDGETALMCALFRGHTSVATELMSFEGIDVNAATPLGATTLMIALASGNISTSKAIMHIEGIQMNAVDWQSWTALMIATRDGCLEAVEALLAVEGIEVNAASPVAGTALTIATSNGHTKIALALLKVKGVEVNTKNSLGWTLLMTSLHNGDTDISKALLSVEGIDVNAVNSMGGTALMIASSNGQTEMVTSLLTFDGVDVNKMNLFGWTALMKASSNGHSSTVALLMENTDVDVNVLSPRQGSALIQGSRVGNREVVEILLRSKRIIVDAADGHGRTALSWAVQQGHHDIEKVLNAWGTRM
ncbi:ankyrin [Coprinopsis marcescibilis]|nr:ankyrin [Coprinopsis marcescibilis]